VNPKRRDRKKMKILKSKKALSPVVASIILIAVTVAVSIAVAAWMGALTFSFMSGTEQAQITHVTWVTDHIYVKVKNKGTASITLTHAYVNNVEKSANITSTTGVLAPGAEEVYDITFIWTPGQTYEVTMETAQNNKFSTVATPPG